MVGGRCVSLWSRSRARCRPSSAVSCTTHAVHMGVQLTPWAIRGCSSSAIPTDIRQGNAEATVQPDWIAPLVSFVPQRFQLDKHESRSTLVEIVADLGRPPRARLANGEERELHTAPVESNELEAMLGHERLSPWIDDRALLGGTLHRVSRFLHPQTGAELGATVRVGCPVPGAASGLEQLLRQGCSVLLVGPAGSGKTTVLREVSRFLADVQSRRVVVVDTYGELCGPDDVPMETAGRLARRVVVGPREEQAAALLRVAKNNGPDAFVIDEVASAAEADAVLEAERRGAAVICGCRGRSLGALLEDPALGLKRWRRFAVVELPPRSSAKESVAWRIHRPMAQGAAEASSVASWRQARSQRKVEPRPDRNSSEAEPEIISLESEPNPVDVVGLAEASYHNHGEMPASVPSPPPPRELTPKKQRKRTKNDDTSKSPAHGRADDWARMLQLSKSGLSSCPDSGLPLFHLVVDASWARAKLPSDLYSAGKEMLTAGADINARDTSSATCLHRLVRAYQASMSNAPKKQVKKLRKCAKDLCDALIELGADARLADSTGRTPADGLSRGDVMVISLLRPPGDPFRELDIFD